MKKVIVLSIVALFALSLCASAENASTTLYPGLNMIAAPLVPFTPDPTTVFNGGAINIDLALVRWDAVGKGYIAFDQWGDPAAFGNVLLGDGYWLRQDAQVTWSYDGVPNGVPDTAGVKTDMWISLPKAGLTMIGHPFKDSVPYANCFMTDGTTTKTLDEARTAGWTDGVAVGWDAQGQGYFQVEIDPWGMYLDLEGSHGYWITTLQDNLALIIPAAP